MATRREFIRGSVGAAPGMSAFAAVATPALNLYKYKALFEERFSASRMFGAEAERSFENLAGGIVLKT
jgi:hypothetical protein